MKTFMPAAVTWPGPQFIVFMDLFICFLASDGSVQGFVLKAAAEAKEVRQMRGNEKVDHDCSRGNARGRGALFTFLSPPIRRSRKATLNMLKHSVNH
jgi:hypothetical protein